MSEQTMSEKLQAHLNSINEKGETKQLVGSAAMIGAGIGGAARLMGKPNASFTKGAIVGAGAGVTAALLIGGGVGIANLIKKAREKGAAETKASIRAAVSRAQDNKKLTGPQKAAIKNNAQAAITKIDQTFKKQTNEQFDDEGVDNVTEDPADANESLGKSILERLNSLVEDNMKKAAAGGAVVGGVAGHAIAKHSAKKAKHAAVNNYKAAVRGTNNAINNAGAAKKIYDKETRVANALKAKQPQGVVAKVKNAVAQHQQAKRVNAAGASLAGHSGVKAAMGKEKQAFNTMKNAMKKVKKPGGGLKGAAIGAGIAAGAYGLHKLANRNK